MKDYLEIPNSSRSLAHRTAIIHGSARIGPGCIIGPNVHIDENVVVGAYCAIGGIPEHRAFYDDVDQERTFGVAIKSGARIFEFVTIHSGTEKPTIIGAEAAIFNHSHVAHDCVIRTHATIGGQVTLAGFVDVGFKANVSGKACVHQHVVIGAYVMISATAFVRNHVPPGELWVGNPARYAGNNAIGLERAGLKKADLGDFEKDFLYWVGRSKLD